ncbi:hypothetical protein BG011_004202 [Mortierella polycephala]|uniref:Uncharacterized protein n=1 Tax=Mortierella polycephala TaxID=41804 RepID=A0A9P6Q2K4_9FUNG|nr:hypothetical protein BG011_004202 [Mortierella polycephala]
MSTAEIIAPNMTTPTVRPKRGLASIKTIFSTKRHTIAQIPTAEQDELNHSAVPETTAESTITSHKSHGPVSTLFTPNQKRALEKAAEKEKKEQVKHSIQMSIVDNQGAFLPPTPLEKGYKDTFIDNDEDRFYTIISTPPERVRTFLSAASTISPGMFSQPSSKIKRRSMPSFPTYRSAGPSPPMIPPKDAEYSPYPQSQVEVSSYSDDLAEALSDSISSLFYH